MGFKRLLYSVTAALIFVLFWGANNYFLASNLPYDNTTGLEQRASFLAASLAEFQFDHPHHRRRHDDHGAIRQQDVIRNPICGGCYHAVAKPEENVQCGYLIHELLTKQNEGMSLVDAAQQVAKTHDPCSRCNPSSCSDEDKIFWRYDSAELLPPVLSSRVPNLPSIPSSHRIPAAAVASLTDFFSREGNAVPNSQYYFDYNPSIVQLPPNYFDRELFSNGGPAAYVASFRISTQQSCFHPSETKAMYGGSWDKKPPVQNYLALAFLRSDLSIVEDVVVDVKASTVFGDFAEDFRLFVLRGKLHVASFDLIAPIQITRKGSSDTSEGEQGYVPIKNVFPSNLQLYMRDFASCPVCHNRPNKRCGKKFNYLEEHNNVYVELWPSGPHVVQHVDLHQPCSESRGRGETDNQNLPTFSDADLEAPRTAWYTMEEAMFPYMKPSETLLTRGRGGACCIPLEDPASGKRLLVGIYHTKIPKSSRQRLPVWVRENGNVTKVLPNQYLSRWYAFDTTEPFQVIAQSGLFCLGYPDSDEVKSQPVIQTTLWKKMHFGGDLVETDGDNSLLVLDCPRIHFVSGIVEKASDPSRVIVAYGVNDCFSRLVEVDKASILRSLFPQGIQ